MDANPVFSYIVLIVMLALIYYFWDRNRKNEPLNPFYKRKKKIVAYDDADDTDDTARENMGRSNEKKKRVNIKELLEVEDIKHGLMRLKNDRFVLVVKSGAVNYYLKSQEEQEGIDAAFEAAISAYDGPEMIIYTQSRRVDYDDHIEFQLNNVKNNRNLNDIQKYYSFSVLNFVDVWQSNTEVYEKHRYFLLPYDLTSKDKRKFKNEDQLYRRIFTIMARRAKLLIDTMGRAGVRNVTVATDRMIYEMLHFALRRSDARHFKLEDALMRESDSLFVTADRDEHQLELVEKIAKEVSASA
ncbi:hypothetical protein ABHN11_13115 [Brevibacillus centrosporus]|uniref:hypothetical protein n=1 Tax=Brevibacillus centrosporus TaxID=54910 RepID=UPI0039863D75